MNEHDWLTSSDPVLLMCGLQGRISPRKYDLFDIACAEREWKYWPTAGCRKYLESMSAEVDEVGMDNELFDRLSDEIAELSRVASQRAAELFAERGLRAPDTVEALRRSVALDLLQTVRGSMEWWYWLNEFQHSIEPETLNQAVESLILDKYRECLPLLRCIVGNPFRPVSSNPSWRTSAVFGLAEGIYSDRAFDRLPLLADALEDAGCDHPDVLAHCRGEGPHARGCWVVDLVLGKL